MMKYIRATKEDIPQIVEKRIAYLHEYHGGMSDDHVDDFVPKLTRYFEEHLNRTIYAYLACDDERVVHAVALLLITEKPARPAFVNGKTGLVLNVYTEPDSRKQGHAEKLMQLLIEEARRFDLDYVELTATESGYPLYQKLGFRDLVFETKPMKLDLRNEH